MKRTSLPPWVLAGVMAVLVLGTLSLPSACKGRGGDESVRPRPLASQPRPAPVWTGLDSAPSQGIASSQQGISDQERLRALAKAWFYGSGQNQQRVVEWINQGASGHFPLLIQQQGQLVMPSWDRGHTLRVLAGSSNNAPEILNWYHQGAGGKPLRARIGTFGSPMPAGTRQAASLPPPGMTVIDHLADLPPPAHLIYGIGWAYAALPNLKLAQQYSLRDELSLVVPPQTVQILTAGFGPGLVYRSQAGDILLHFTWAGQDYYVLVESYHFRLEPAAEHPGFARRVRLDPGEGQPQGRFKEVRVLAASDPPGRLAELHLQGGPHPVHWSLIAEGWENL